MLKYIRLKDEHIELVLGWRMMPHITNNMLSDIENSIEKQRQWFKNIKKDKSSIYWIISYENKHIGLAYITKIDFKNLETTQARSSLKFGGRLSDRKFPYFDLWELK